MNDREVLNDAMRTVFKQHREIRVLNRQLSGTVMVMGWALYAAYGVALGVFAFVMWLVMVVLTDVVTKGAS